jgi:uncharacterized phage infection (PIP) family protein YhgE
VAEELNRASDQDLNEIVAAAVAEVEKAKATTNDLVSIESDIQVVEKGAQEILAASDEIAAALTQVKKSIEQISAAATEADKAATEASGAAQQQSKGAEDLAAAIEQSRRARFLRGSIRNIKQSMTAILRGRVVPLKGFNSLLGISAVPLANADDELAVLLVQVLPGA